MSARRASHDELEQFRTIVTREAGLRCDDDKLPLLRSLLESRMAETGLTAGVYLDGVASTRSEVSELARSLSVNETYFFRNPCQFRALAAILRQRQEAGARHLRMLSAGCSSGEEAYSLAILALETLDHPEQWSITIRGVDLDPGVIEKARAAHYSAWSLRELPEGIRRRYFRCRGRDHVLDDAVRNMVRFEQRNLFGEGTLLWRPEAYDIVFFRNVLMYFTRDAATQVLREVARSLTVDGYLFVGHAENLRGLSEAFDLRNSHDTFYYRRKAEGVDRRPLSVRRPRTSSVERSVDSPESWFDAIDQAARRIERLSHRSEVGTEEPPAAPEAAPRDGEASSVGRADLLPALELAARERFHEALEAVMVIPAGDADAMLVRAALLASMGRLDDATAVCEEILALDQLNAGAHYIIALVREHVGDCAGAIEHARVAGYLDRDFAMPRLQLGRLARQAGDKATAFRELRVAMGLLPREDPARIVLFGGGFSREALVQLCRGELRACGVADDR